MPNQESTTSMEHGITKAVTPITIIGLCIDRILNNYNYKKKSN